MNVYQYCIPLLAYSFALCFMQETTALAASQEASRKAGIEDLQLKLPEPSSESQEPDIAHHLGEGVKVALRGANSHVAGAAAGGVLAGIAAMYVSQPTRRILQSSSDFTITAAEDAIRFAVPPQAISVAASFLPQILGGAAALALSCWLAYRFEEGIRAPLKAKLKTQAEALGKADSERRLAEEALSQLQPQLVSAQRAIAQLTKNQKTTTTYLNTHIPQLHKTVMALQLQGQSTDGRLAAAEENQKHLFSAAKKLYDRCASGKADHGFLMALLKETNDSRHTYKPSKAAPTAAPIQKLTLEKKTFWERWFCCGSVDDVAQTTTPPKRQLQLMQITAPDRFPHGTSDEDETAGFGSDEDDDAARGSPLFVGVPPRALAKRSLYKTRPALPPLPPSPRDHTVVTRADTGTGINPPGMQLR